MLWPGFSFKRFFRNLTWNEWLARERAWARAPIKNFLSGLSDFAWNKWLARERDMVPFMGLVFFAVFRIVIKFYVAGFGLQLFGLLNYQRAPISGILCALCFLYTAVWAPAAIFAAASGKCTHPLAWIVIPIYPIFALFGKIGVLLNRIKEGGSFIALYVICGLVFLFVIELIVIKAPWSVLPLFGISVVFACGIFYAVVSRLFSFLEDSRRLNRVKRTLNALNVASLESELHAFKSDAFRARTIRTIREGALLTPTSDTVRVLRGLAHRVETAAPKGIASKALENLLKIDKAEYLDELSLLIEATQKRVGGT
jgi:hypothetical protein